MTVNSAPPIIVAGSGRSGTTWLGNIIAGDNFRILFEPLDYRRVPEAKGLNLRPYFRPDGVYPQWHSIINKILIGEVSNEWVDQDRYRLNPASPATGLLVKEIRGNGLLGWLKNNFPCQIVFLLRHPWAVVSSRMNLGWDAQLEEIIAQQELFTDYLSDYTRIIASVDTPAKRHAVMWCVENLVPLKQLPDTGCCTVYYEDLVMQTETEVTRILKFLGIPLTESRKIAMQELSRTSRSEGARSAESLLGGWKNHLTQSDVAAIAEVINAFGISIYSAESLQPLRRPL